MRCRGAAPAVLALLVAPGCAIDLESAFPPVDLDAADGALWTSGDGFGANPGDETTTGDADQRPTDPGGEGAPRTDPGTADGGSTADGAGTADTTGREGDAAGDTSPCIMDCDGIACGPDRACGLACPDTCADQGWACSSTGSCISCTDGTPCDDSNFCTTNDACDPAGQCVGEAAPMLDVVCAPPVNGCHLDSRCDGAGACRPKYRSSGEEGDCGVCFDCNGAGGCKLVPAGDPDLGCQGPDQACSLSDQCNGAGGCNFRHLNPGSEGNAAAGLLCPVCSDCNGAGGCAHVLDGNSDANCDGGVEDCSLPDECRNGVCQLNHRTAGSQGLCSQCWECSGSGGPCVESSGTTGTCFSNSACSILGCDGGVCVETLAPGADCAPPAFEGQACCICPAGETGYQYRNCEATCTWGAWDDCASLGGGCGC